MFVARDPDTGELRVLSNANGEAPERIPSPDKTIRISVAEAGDECQPAGTLVDFIRRRYPDWKTCPNDESSIGLRLFRIAEEENMTFDFTGICSEIKPVSSLDDLD